MSTKTIIFLTGATGYIGGTILQRLLSHPKADTFVINALTRDLNKAAQLSSLGVKTVIGSHSDLDKLEDSAAEADIVITAADCDDVSAATAILRGQKKKFLETGKAPILIHTSGTGVLVDNAKGMYASDVVYSDTDISLIETLKPSQPHRPVDILVSEAGAEGYVKTHIVLPSTIYGIAQGSLFDKGISNPQSVQVPALIIGGWNRGQGGMIGQGKNIWPCVHIEEIGDLYMVLFDALVSGQTIPNGREGFYFGESDHYLVYDLAKSISVALAELGHSKSEEPIPFTDDDRQKYLGGRYVLAGNSRCRADRARALGWKPSKTTKDLLASVKPELKALLASGRIKE
ncbi:NAD(P)-binding protein [Heliocybe sulcata]|uniref:NAD(P)-binding protein n=1 Tax=Heliocybe sulcata TaxID=5364 RepID=A0A5C3NF74_9AGAM|nr:NAD(P)-binding protein [Heliocybe sulcata]